MWNYNLDEMPKDGSKIIGFFKDGKYESTSVFYYDFDDWRRVSHCLPVSIRYLQCWALAPEDPESDGVEKLIDWFDHWFDYVFPSIANDYGVPYWKGLKALRDRIELELSQSGCKEPKMTDKPCVACCMYHYGDGESVCLMCGRFQGKANG